MLTLAILLAMQSFIDTGADFHVLDGMQPLIERASVDENGVLSLEGSYPTTPSKFTFRHRYVYEGLDWKLIGTNSKIG